MTENTLEQRISAVDEMKVKPTGTYQRIKGTNGQLCTAQLDEIVTTINLPISFSYPTTGASNERKSLPW